MASHAKSGIQSTDNTIQDTISSIDQQISAALEKYRQRMRAANERFLNDRINEIQTVRGPERVRMGLFTRYWHHTNIWPMKIEQLPVHGEKAVQQARLETTVRSLEDARKLDHPYMDGVMPPSLTTAPLREAFVEEFEAVLNEKIGKDTSLPPIRVNEELKSFIKYANGVRDPDFRYSATCEWELVDTPSDGWPADGRESRQAMRNRFQTLCFTPEKYEYPAEDQLEFLVGFAAGASYFEGYNAMRSYYLYCRPRPDEPGQQPGPWAWKIVFISVGELQCPVNETEDDERYIFDSIPEFLEWYGSWVDRIDLESVKDLMSRPLEEHLE